MEQNPCLTRDLEQQVDDVVDTLATDAKALLSRYLGVDKPVRLHEAEQAIAVLSRRAQDGITAALIRHRLADPVFEARTSEAARCSGRYRHGGRRDFSVTLLGGSKIRVNVAYLKRDLRCRVGRKRGIGRRGRGGSGMYPALVALGLPLGTTPALSSELCHQVSSSDSLQAGCDALKRRGIDLGLKPTRRLFNKLSRRAVEQRRAWLEAARQRPSSDEPSPLAGKRVVVATDGGRTRIRENRRGRRKKNGRRGFDALWREPKTIVVYVIDDEGEIEHEFRPVYDGTFQGCDSVFEMLTGYLRALGIEQARELIVVGDGAHWIWDRVPELAEKAGLSASQVTEVVDWYHAVQKLHEVAKACASWSKEKREKWVRRAKKRLYAGDIDAVVAMIKKLARGRRAREVGKHVGYFERNRARMQYAAFEAAAIPRGSGVVESMIRRVVNLRLKGNAKYWLEENAEGMLLVRSYLKAGRLEDLMAWSDATAASWWAPAVAAVPASPLGMGP